MQVSDMIQMMADRARLEKRPLPIIETDYESARIIADVLAEEIGCFAAELIPSGVLGIMCMFDGVKIVRRKVTAEELYREHFGVLAEIWGDHDLPGENVSSARRRIPRD